MRLAEAEGLWTPGALRGSRGPQFAPHDLDADREGLIKLAEWCQRFSPLVGLEGTDCLRIEVTGCAHLFGGEWGLARRVLHDFRRCGLRAQIALADTAGAAWAAARYGKGGWHDGKGGWHDLRAAMVVAHDTSGGRGWTERSEGSPGTSAETRTMIDHKSEISDLRSEIPEDSNSSIRNLQSAIRNTQSPSPRSQLRWERDAIRIVPPGEQQRAMNTLPVEALRLPVETVSLLHTLSLRCLGQLFDLPRSTLPARFGPELLERIDQALGRISEPIVAVRPQPPVSADWTLPAPTADRCALGNAVSRLIRQVVQRLVPRHEGVQELEVRFRQTDGQATSLIVGTVQPTASWQHLLNLALTQLEQAQLLGEVLSVTVVARSIAPLPCDQPQLLESALPQKNRRALAQLADRLTTRLGRDHVVQPVLHADPQPELAVHWGEDIRSIGRSAGSRRRPELEREPPGSTRRTAGPNPAARWGDSKFGFQGSSFSARPLQLLPEPEPIDVDCTAGSPVRVTRGGHVHQVATCCGPERIESGWWRGADVQRDYFRVDTAEGLRLWMFRRIEQQDWFLHGEFE